MHKTIVKFIGLIFVVTATLISCGKPNLPSIDTGTSPFPAEVSDLYVEKGNTNSTTALLYVQGGPAPSLNTYTFDLAGLSAYHEVYVHQTNTLNTTLLTDVGPTMPHERAIREGERSAEYLYRVVKKFRGEGKNIIIIANSWGSFVVAQYISEHHTENLVSKYVLTMGRLDLEENVWQGYRDGQPHSFVKGNPVAVSLDAAASRQNVTQSVLLARMNLTAGLAEKRYTQRLAGMNLSNLIYVYSSGDEILGPLSTAEGIFLAGRSATVVPITGPHNTALLNLAVINQLKTLLGL